MNTKGFLSAVSILLFLLGVTRSISTVSSESDRTLKPQTSYLWVNVRLEQFVQHLNVHLPERWKIFKKLKQVQLITLILQIHCCRRSLKRVALGCFASTLHLKGPDTAAIPSFEACLLLFFCTAWRWVLHHYNPSKGQTFFVNCLFLEDSFSLLVRTLYSTAFVQIEFVVSNQEKLWHLLESFVSDSRASFTCTAA